MKFNINKNVIKAAIKKWGKDKQRGMITEEFSELLIAVNKYDRSPTDINRYRITEELADCLIMIESCMAIHRIEGELVQDEINSKMLRLNHRLNR